MGGQGGRVSPEPPAGFGNLGRLYGRLDAHMPDAGAHTCVEEDPVGSGIEAGCRNFPGVRPGTVNPGGTPHEMMMLVCNRLNMYAVNGSGGVGVL